MFSKHDLRCDAVKLHVAARRQEREAPTICVLEVLPASAEQRPKASVEPELLAMMTNEVEHRAERLPGKPTQASAKLLEEQRRAIGGAKQQQRVDGRDVDALVEEVDREERVDASGREVCQRSRLARCRGCRPIRRPPESQLPGTPGP